MTLQQILDLREKVKQGDKNSANQYVEYAVIRKLEKEGMEDKVATELAKLFMAGIEINLEVING